jgi:uncharacterized protein
MVTPAPTRQSLAQWLGGALRRWAVALWRTPLDRLWLQGQQRRYAQQQRQTHIQRIITEHPDADIQVGEHYVRVGNCTQCGKCCESIHLAHKGNYIRNTLHFKWLQLWSSAFRHFVPIGISETGVVFRCRALLPDKRCGIYGNRPRLCHLYPSELVRIAGQTLPEECEYDFVPIMSFQQALANHTASQSINPASHQPASALIPISVINNG